MKATLPTRDFQIAVSNAGRVTGKHLSLPILRCLLVVTTKNEITIRATNLDLGIEIRIPARVEKEGVFAVPADVLDAFVSNISSGDVLTISHEGSTLHLSTPKTKAKIGTFSHEDFPSLPAVPDEEHFTVGAGEFAGALRSVSWAASASSIKPELGSVYLYPNGDELVFVATDSFRLAEKKIPAKPSKKFESLLIPLRNVTEIIRHLEESKRDVVIRGDGHQIALTLDGTYITSRVIEGVFPDYHQIIPKTHDTDAVLLKQDLADALKQLRVFSDQFNKLTASIDPKKKTFTLASANQTTGESIVTLDAALSGEPLELHFNLLFVSDCLQSVRTDSVKIEFGGGGKPARITPIGDASFVYIVMPMNR
ncbi:MAG: DNA polymerase III subunit beta [Patescibacteria group bacterium]